MKNNTEWTAIRNAFSDSIKTHHKTKSDALKKFTGIVRKIKSGFYEVKNNSNTHLVCKRNMLKSIGYVS